MLPVVTVTETRSDRMRAIALEAALYIHADYITMRAPAVYASRTILRAAVI